MRSGAWQKMRVNRGQEFVIGGYTVGSKAFDALIFGYYEGDRLIYAVAHEKRIYAGRAEQLFQKFHKLEIKHCPFVNPPEAKRMGSRPHCSEDEGLSVADQSLWRGSSFWSGLAKITSGIPSSLHCATIRPHARSVESSRTILRMVDQASSHQE